MSRMIFYTSIVVLGGLFLLVTNDTMPLVQVVRVGIFYILIAIAQHLLGNEEKRK